MKGMAVLKEDEISKVLQKALGRGGEFADIFFERLKSTSIICEKNRIEKIITGVDQGVGIRVIFDQRTVYAYSNEFGLKALLELAEILSRAVERKIKSELISLEKKGALLSFNIQKPPGAIDLKKKVSLVKRANSTARSFHKSIQQVKITYEDRIQDVTIANSEGLIREGKRIGTTFSVLVVAADGEVLQTGYEPIGGFVGLELFDETPPEKVAEVATSRAVRMLRAKPPRGGVMPVVLSSEAGGTMIHEAIGHGLEADLAQQGLSVYSNQMGDLVASPLISIVDDSTLPGRRGSYPFDDEGTESQRTLLVNKGILISYLSDRLAAMKDGKVSTGNGRRESFRYKPIPRMSNTFILPGETPPDEILRSTKEGLYVKKMGGGEVNTVNGDFVFEVTEGYLIEDGRIGEPVRGATLTGNGPEILKKVDMVGNDLGFGIGTCGKDGQGVPVSDAQPTLRIPEIIVGGEVKKR
jgi:TldD protein